MCRSKQSVSGILSDFIRVETVMLYATVPLYNILKGIYEYEYNMNFNIKKPCVMLMKFKVEG